MPTLPGQDDRTARFTSPLGKDRLSLLGFTCREGVSALFEIRVDVIGPEEPVDFDALIGQHGTIEFETPEHGTRSFDGIVAEGRQTGWLRTFRRYEIVLRPWLWLMSFRSNCRIFHEQAAPDIIETIFGDHGFSSFESRLSRSYPQLEYCVQYRETDLDFVCRLMEQHGISYYFSHEAGDHKLVLADESSSFTAVPGSSRRFLAEERGRFGEGEIFTDWIAERRFTSGRVKLTDYDFKKPKADLAVDKSADTRFEHGTLEVYDFPGNYVVQGDGSGYAEALINSERARDGRAFARGRSVGLFSGGLVTLTDHPDDDRNTEYLVLGCVHSYANQSYLSGEPASGGEAYSGAYELLPSDRPFAPPQVTEAPRIHGVQTALVIGDDDVSVDGEFVEADEFGRIRVRFPWDQDEGHSMLCRVAHLWAGDSFGSSFTPRAGMEVVVQFLEGDPDRPLVMGTVYNATNMPPYPLPSEKTKSGVKSRSEYDASAYNELMFDDSQGHELVRVHAGRDLETEVVADEQRTVKGKRETTISNNDTLTVNGVLHIESPTKVEIVVGTSKITMTPEKITIESLEIEINAQHLTSTAVLSEHNAAGVMSIIGSIVKINS